MPQTPERFGSMANKEEVILLLREEKLENVPLSTPVISHGLESSLNSGGVQCIAVLDSRKPFAACLGLPDHKSVASNSCFLQVTDPLELFRPQCEADSAKTLELSLEDYLQLYAFFLQRFCRCSRQRSDSEFASRTATSFGASAHAMPASHLANRRTHTKIICHCNLQLKAFCKREAQYMRTLLFYPQI